MNFGNFLNNNNSVPAANPKTAPAVSDAALAETSLPTANRDLAFRKAHIAKVIPHLAQLSDLIPSPQLQERFADIIKTLPPPNPSPTTTSHSATVLKQMLALHEELEKQYCDRNLGYWKQQMELYVEAGTALSEMSDARERARRWVREGCARAAKEERDFDHTKAMPVTDEKSSWAAFMLAFLNLERDRSSYLERLNYCRDVLMKRYQEATNYLKQLPSNQTLSEPESVTVAVNQSREVLLEFEYESAIDLQQVRIQFAQDLSNAQERVSHEIELAEMNCQTIAQYLHSNSHGLKFVKAFLSGQLRKANRQLRDVENCLTSLTTALKSVAEIQDQLKGLETAYLAFYELRDLDINFRIAERLGCNQQFLAGIWNVIQQRETDFLSLWRQAEKPFPWKDVVPRCFQHKPAERNDYLRRCSPEKVLDLCDRQQLVIDILDDIQNGRNLQQIFFAFDFHNYSYDTTRIFSFDPDQILINGVVKLAEPLTDSLVNPAAHAIVALARRGVSFHWERLQGLSIRADESKRQESLLYLSKFSLPASLKEYSLEELAQHLFLVSEADQPFLGFVYYGKPKGNLSGFKSYLSTRHEDGLIIPAVPIICCFDTDRSNLVRIWEHELAHFEQDIMEGVWACQMRPLGRYVLGEVAARLAEGLDRKVATDDQESLPSTPFLDSCEVEELKQLMQLYCIDELENFRKMIVWERESSELYPKTTLYAINDNMAFTPGKWNDQGPGFIDQVDARRAARKEYLDELLVQVESYITELSDSKLTQDIEAVLEKAKCFISQHGPGSNLILRQAFLNFDSIY